MFIAQVEPAIQQYTSMNNDDEDEEGERGGGREGGKWEEGLLHYLNSSYLHSSSFTMNNTSRVYIYMLHLLN